MMTQRRKRRKSQWFRKRETLTPLRPRTGTWTMLAGVKMTSKRIVTTT